MTQKIKETGPVVSFTRVAPVTHSSVSYKIEGTQTSHIWFVLKFNQDSKVFEDFSDTFLTLRSIKLYVL